MKDSFVWMGMELSQTLEIVEAFFAQWGATTIIETAKCNPNDAIMKLADLQASCVEDLPDQIIMAIDYRSEIKCVAKPKLGEGSE